MEGYMIWEWGLILPGCGGTLTFPREATPAARPFIGRRRPGEGPRLMGLGIGKRWDESHLSTVLVLYLVIRN